MDDIYAYAALARIADPLDYSLREIILRAEAIEREEWSRTIQLSDLIRRIFGGGKKDVDLDAINPYPRRTRKTVNPSQTGFKEFALGFCVEKKDERRRSGRR